MQIHIDVQSKKSVAIHWGTFALANEVSLLSGEAGLGFCARATKSLVGLRGPSRPSWVFRSHAVELDSVITGPAELGWPCILTGHDLFMRSGKSLLLS